MRRWAVSADRAFRIRVRSDRANSAGAARRSLETGSITTEAAMDITVAPVLDTVVIVTTVTATMATVTTAMAGAAVGAGAAVVMACGSSTICSDSP